MKHELLQFHCVQQLHHLQGCQHQGAGLRALPLSEYLQQQSDKTGPDRLEEFVETDGGEAHEEDADAEEDEDKQRGRGVLLLHHLVQ